MTPLVINALGRGRGRGHKHTPTHEQKRFQETVALRVRLTTMIIMA